MVETEEGGGGSVVVGVVRGLYDNFATPSKKKATDYGAGGGVMALGRIGSEDGTPRMEADAIVTIEWFYLPPAATLAPRRLGGELDHVERERSGGGALVETVAPLPPPARKGKAGTDGHHPADGDDDGDNDDGRRTQRKRATRLPRRRRRAADATKAVHPPPPTMMA